MAESYIKEYSLLDFVADGYGVEDQPYEINNFYIYGNQSISIKTSGEEMLSSNPAALYDHRLSPLGLGLGSGLYDHRLSTPPNGRTRACAFPASA